MPNKSTIDDETDDDADEQVHDGMAEVINIGDMPMRFNIEGRKITLKRGQTTRVERAYVYPPPGPNGDPTVPVVERLTGNNVVASDSKKGKQFKAGQRPTPDPLIPANPMAAGSKAAQEARGNAAK